MKLLTINQVADQLSLTPKTIYAYVHFKRIPFVKVAGALRFDPVSIEAWLASNSHDALPVQPKPAYTGKKRGRRRGKHGVSGERIDKIVEQAKAGV